MSDTPRVTDDTLKLLELFTKSDVPHCYATWDLQEAVSKLLTERTALYQALSDHYAVIASAYQAYGRLWSRDIQEVSEDEQERVMNMLSWINEKDRIDCPFEAEIPDEMMGKSLRRVKELWNL